MAEYTFRLNRPVIKFESPFVTIVEGYHDAQVDTFKILPSKYKKTHNIFIPVYIVIGYVASAVVANRSVYIKKWEKKNEMVFVASDSITASESKRLVVTGQDLNLMTDAGQGGHSMAAMLPSAFGVNWATIDDNDDENYLTIFTYQPQAGDTIRFSATFLYANKLLGLPNVYDGTDEEVIEVQRGC